MIEPPGCHPVLVARTLTLAAAITDVVDIPKVRVARYCLPDLSTFGATPESPCICSQGLVGPDYRGIISSVRYPTGIQELQPSP